MELVRVCPKCGHERPMSEMLCGFQEVPGKKCNWRLADVIPTSKEQLDNQAREEEPAVEASENLRLCTNGHPVPEDEFICMECGADVMEETSEISSIQPDVSEPMTGVNIEGWAIQQSIPSTLTSRECYRVENVNEKSGYLVLFHEDHEPDTTIYDVLQNTDHDHVPDILSIGRWNQRSFEIFEWIDGGSLLEHSYFSKDDLDGIKRIVDELGRALHDLAEMGVRHRNICPRTVLIRTEEPLDLVITDFSSARLSDFDLDTVAPLDVSRYSAPETIVGGVSTASDWWGLGMILLEQVTEGACFEGINEQAFTIHLVTRGIEIPDDISEPIRSLLLGLLTRDPLQRWQWNEVRKWLDDEAVEIPEEHRKSPISTVDHAISINDVDYIDVEQLALGLATELHWEKGLTSFENGEIATWLQSSYPESNFASKVRHLMTQGGLAVSWRFALALMELNPALPLVNEGLLITPAWLLENPIEAYLLITGELPSRLEAMEREPWLVHLHYRHQNVLERAKLLEIDVDESRLCITSLATSRANLDAERDRLREMYPASLLDTLNNLLEKTRLNEEDLVLLLCARTEQFTPAETVVHEAISLAKKYNQSSMGAEEIREIVTLSRREIYDLLDEKICDFASCNQSVLDQWADEFRVQRQITLPRAVVLLSVDDDQWVIPPKQDYAANILGFFEKRVTNSVMRGPLVRLTISKTSARIDMTELDSALKPANALLEHLLCRNETPVQVDPQVFQTDQVRERRLWRLNQAAQNNRRDTGIDTLYLGFPFLVIGHEKVRPRIAPVFLLPIKMEFTVGAGAKLTLGFDMDRAAVRLNPALEGLISRDVMKDWRRILSELLERDRLTVNEVIDAVSTLAPATNQGLQKHPPIQQKVSKETFECHGSAVIFNAQFSGQAIAEDLHQLQRASIKETSLETLLRIKESPEGALPEECSESDRFTVVPADPSQDRAVLQGRNNPGVVVEGPPGTGKSQTIVNIIADCIGRKEKVLVVCQKQAALRVVEKRLEAVKLNHRLLSINDISKDRQAVIRTIREQVPLVLNADQGKIRQAAQNRLRISQQIDDLEKELNQRHEVIQSHDDLTGLTYRQILCELINIDEQDKGNIIIQPSLRRLLSSVTPTVIFSLEEETISLANDWLHSHYEKSNLHCFNQFHVDGELFNRIKSTFSKYLDSEKSRFEISKSTTNKFDDRTLKELVEWRDKVIPKLQAFDDEQITLGGIWYEEFYDEVNTKSEGEDTLDLLMGYFSDLEQLNVKHHDDRFFTTLNTTEKDELETYIQYSEYLLVPARGIGKLNPFRFLKKRTIKKLLEDHNEMYSIENVQSLLNAASLESELLAIRSRLSSVLDDLSRPFHQNSKLTLKYLKRYVAPLVKRATLMINFCSAVKKCPLKADAKAMLKSGNRDSVNAFVGIYEAAVARAEAREKSLLALTELKSWVKPDWYQSQWNNILSGDLDIDSITNVFGEIDNLEIYQRFLLRSKGTDSITFQVLAELRDIESELLEIPSNQLGRQIARSVRREAYLGWKLRIEETIPSLLIGKNELENKISTLSELDEQKTNLNRLLLSHQVDVDLLGTQTQWNDITRLRGARYKKLREFIDQGLEIGLMELRPVWLMSPEAVSQALPRLAGMFDVVVFDEASQMMVDFAIPALYRSKRVVISGDEKQMPPSNFFGSNVEIDESEGFEDLDEDASEAEVAHHEEAWNRREIKDCPDLLVLGKTVLPTKTLEIHYRSSYRALIDYSNYAYYSGGLHVPALHPEEVVKREKPIEVHDVKGIYTDQTNPDEANKIVELIAETWMRPPEERPSLGVVTFNKKQSELIEDTLQAYAENNPDFYQAYLIEQDRQQEGEDMGFFVKNVENVQGDERDVILFSTTFGLNEHGSFRRNFGALGHKGGERRLNVAVTRARHKVVIATSMPIRDISDMLVTGRMPNKPRDYIQAYLEYASKISVGEIRHAKQRISKIAKSVSSSLDQEVVDGFTQSVEEYLVSIGYKPERGHNEDAFSVDLTIIDPKTGLYGLGIECDAPVNSLLHNARARDIWRPRVLEKSIPLIHRINCFDWYRDNNSEKQKLKEIVLKAVG